MSETESTEEKLQGRLEDLASDPKYLKEYVGIRVDILSDQEQGTIIVHGENLEEVKKAMKKDMEDESPGNEYHIFYPQREGKTAREVSSIFAPGNQFMGAKK